MPDNSLDTFRYLSRLVLVDMIFELKHPLLSQVERHHRFDNSIISSVDPESGQRLSGDGRFHAFLSQGVFHDDIATWVDIDMAAYVLETISNWISLSFGAPATRYRQRDRPRHGSHQEQTVQDLLHNLMDILMAGIARDPQIRKDFYSK